MHACARVRRFHAVCSPLGNERSETKNWQFERGRGRKKERQNGRKAERKWEKKEMKKKKRSKDRLVARIGFRTVSNDTSRDATAMV